MFPMFGGHILILGHFEEWVVTGNAGSHEYALKFANGLELET
jgi:hypothetical protein